MVLFSPSGVPFREVTRVGSASAPSASRSEMQMMSEALTRRYTDSEPTPAMRARQRSELRPYPGHGSVCRGITLTSVPRHARETPQAARAHQLPNRSR